MSHLIETVYNLLWGDLFTLPVGGGFQLEKSGIFPKKCLHRDGSPCIV